MGAVMHDAATKKVATIRVVKAMQTAALQQYVALTGVLAAEIDPDMADELSDAMVTADNHAAALQHIIDKLTA